MTHSLTRAEVLRELVDLSGVVGAAFVDSGGALLEGAPAGAPLLVVAPSLGGYLASGRVLAELLGAEVATQTVLEFEGQTVLLTRLADAPEAPLSVVALASAEDVGRVRFGLRRLLPLLTGGAADQPTPARE